MVTTLSALVIRMMSVLDLEEKKRKLLFLVGKDHVEACGNHDFPQNNTFFEDGNYGKGILKQSKKIQKFQKISDSKEVFIPCEIINVCVCCVFQECDQVHIDDVSSDDNGQDLRYDFNLWLNSHIKCAEGWADGLLFFFLSLPVHTTLPPTVSTRPQPVPISA